MLPDALARALIFSTLLLFLVQLIGFISGLLLYRQRPRGPKDAGWELLRVLLALSGGLLLVQAIAVFRSVTLAVVPYDFVDVRLWVAVLGQLVGTIVMVWAFWRIGTMLP